MIGRNGSGKSSFAEGLEVLLTGDNLRWSTKSKVWKDGWKNLHYEGATELHAELDIEGVGATTTVECKWQPDAELDDAETTVQHKGKPRRPLASLNWKRPLELYRPFLSYTELANMSVEGPTSMYDRMSAMLGLEDLVSGQKALARERLSRKRFADEVHARATELVSLLEQIDDQRAQQCAAKLGAKKWDLEAISSLVSQPMVVDDTRLRLLRQVIALEAPTHEAVDALASNLTQVANRVDEASAAPAGEARDLASLLDAAVRYWRAHPAPTCPVCGFGPLGDEWAERSAAAIARLNLTAKLAHDAQEARRRVLEEVRAMTAPAPRALRDLGSSLKDAEDLALAWSEFSTVDASDLRLVATRLRVTSATLRKALDAFIKSAQLEVAQREHDWLVIAAPVWTWLADARESVEKEAAARELHKAETWLKGTAGEIRLLRFEPIAEAARTFWKTFGEGDLDLEQVGLEGSGPARHPVLRVDVDGVESDALSVMSQGQLNSIALSLFLPRATLPESPFRFLVIDDPVQSMDPARVDGLARVLEGVARTRQVVVFTHDNRLPEAARRLQIDATVYGVRRGDRSTLLVRLEMEPVARALADARVLALTDELPEALASRVVPGHCRVALEAASAEVVRRRRLARGEAHAEVDSVLEDCNLTQLLALVLFDDPGRAGEVGARMNREFGPTLADAYHACNKGSHVGYSGSLGDLINATDQLASRIRSFK